MALYSSYRHLRDNARAAMLASIEIYNKPQIAYRDECFVILLVNAWELLFKALLAKNKRVIYYAKKRNEPYRTFSLQDAMYASEHLLPTTIQYQPVKDNIEMLLAYRNNAIHFYNQAGFPVLVYGLAQTSIINFRDVMLGVFGVDIAHEMTMSLLPLGFGPQPDPVEFLKTRSAGSKKSKAVAQFVAELVQITNDLETANLDAGRFLTVFSVQLQSVKKVASADIVVGLAGNSPVQDANNPLIIERRVDPNISHPLKRKDALVHIGNNLNGHRFTSHTFDALIWKNKFKEKPHLCWQSSDGAMTKYSSEVVSLLRQFKIDEIDVAVKEYGAWQNKRGKKQ